MAEAARAAAHSVVERIARVIDECQTPLGYARHGISSWERELIEQWSARDPVVLNGNELMLLANIERQVFGDG